MFCSCKNLDFNDAVKQSTRRICIGSKIVDDVELQSSIITWRKTVQITNGATLKIGRTVEGATLKIGATLVEGATLKIGAALVEGVTLKIGATLLEGTTVTNDAAVMVNGAPRCLYCWNPVVLELTNRNLRSSCCRWPILRGPFP